MRWMVVLVVALLMSSFAGCLNESGDNPRPTEAGKGDVASVARAVVGIVDSGINAYHVQFRDNGSDAWRHPSLYLDGYPPDAQSLRIDLNATTWEEAIAADCELWNGLEADVLYWIPGTRIVGLRIAPDRPFDEPVDCTSQEVPMRGLDTRYPHGTGVAGRAAGTTTSLCPECKIVMAQSSHRTEDMLWMAQQPWIDLQSNSWLGYFCHQLNEPATGCDRGLHEWAREATELQVTFAASGNGIRGNSFEPVRLGVGIPTYLRPAQGHEGVIVVGGHDNGEIIVWPGSMPHVVADAAKHPSAAWNNTSADGVFGGTSGATPFAAGVFAKMLLEARTMVRDNGTGLRNGDLVIAATDADLPSDGPLADGRLTRIEAERLFMTTANPRPVEEQPYDGGLGCPMSPPPAVRLCIERSNSLGPWTQVPDDVPAYYFLGYGQVGVGSLETMIKVLTDQMAIPERPVEDELFQVDATARGLLEE